MYISKESFDSKVLRWSGLAVIAFIVSVFTAGLVTSSDDLSVAAERSVRNVVQLSAVSPASIDTSGPRSVL